MNSILLSLTIHWMFVTHFDINEVCHRPSDVELYGCADISKLPHACTIYIASPIEEGFNWVKQHEIDHCYDMTHKDIKEL